MLLLGDKNLAKNISKIAFFTMQSIFFLDFFYPFLLFFQVAVDLGITYSKMKVFFLRWKECEEFDPSLVQNLLSTLKAQVVIK